MRVGILGGGQLARMMVSAGLELGLEFVVLDPAPDACAGRCASLINKDWALAPEQPELQACDRITCDFENVPASVLEALSTTLTVRPGPRAFHAAQDRLVEKSLFRELGIPVPAFAAVSSRPELLAAIEKMGFPAVLKTRRLGYDGKGQAVLRHHEDLEPAWRKLGEHPLILEAWVPFDHEFAITGVRTAAGETRFYPASFTCHEQGILRLAMAPAGLDQAMVETAEAHIGCLMEHLDYVGCLTLELFAGEFGLLANEFAPRVHNSAHWTIEGSETSQFENHLRAVCDLPLGSTNPRGHAVMLNWIGSMPAREQLLAVPGLCWHDYGKSDRPGRKVGHATLVADSQEELQQRIERLRPLLDAQTASLLSGAMTPLG